MGLHMVRGKALEVKAYTQGGSRVKLLSKIAFVVTSASTGFVNFCPTDTSLLLKPWYKKAKTQKDSEISLPSKSFSVNIILREVQSRVHTKLCPPPLINDGFAVEN